MAATKTMNYCPIPGFLIRPDFSSPICEGVMVQGRPFPPVPLLDTDPFTVHHHNHRFMDNRLTRPQITGQCRPALPLQIVYQLLNLQGPQFPHL